MNTSQEEVKKDDSKPWDVQAITIFWPKPGAVKTPFRISGSSTCNSVTITVFDCNTSTNIIGPTSVSVTDSVYIFSFDLTTVNCNNASITVECDSDRTKMCTLTGLEIYSIKVDTL